MVYQFYVDLAILKFYIGKGKSLDSIQFRTPSIVDLLDFWVWIPWRSSKEKYSAYRKTASLLLEDSMNVFSV